MSDGGPAWLVTGGAGYIGAHITRRLQGADLPVVIIDNLSTGLAVRIPESVPLHQGDCADHEFVRRILLEHDVVGVMHLAGLKQARESARHPLKYWVNNLGAILGLLQAIEDTRVRYFVLSSSCSVYGAAGPVTSDQPFQPMSPYARSKLVSEQMLQDTATELNLSTAVLRYFNVVGNDDFRFAHDTSEECLVPNAYAKLTRGEPVQVFGTEHQTPDGTSLRDYVDVRDLATAHLHAAEYLMSHELTRHIALDVGVGYPVSVKEILQTLAEVSGKAVLIDDVGSHSADPASVWAEASLARTVLNWTPSHDIVSSISAHVHSVNARDTSN